VSTAPDGVRQISYDYRTCRGTLLLDAGSSCDVERVVALFAAVDPQVRFVRAIAGRQQSAIFEKIANHWVAFR
jgi:hypothetical protein